MLNKRQIRKIERLLDQSHELAVKTDMIQGNADECGFLPNNRDYIYYSAILDVCSLLGYCVQGKMCNGKAKHLLF